MTPGHRAALVLFGLGCAALAYVVGDGYIARLSAPGGFLPVTVRDAVRTPAPRPRRTVVVVADGLRRDAALDLIAVDHLAAAGQCRTMDVGAPTVSRPIYATLSTGLGPDRSGVRNNDDASPAAAESVWQVARAHGLTVLARSELDWLRELFPAGFDGYEVIPRPRPYFAPAPLGDLTLIHPVYVDEAGHDHGAASPEYAAAVARLDGELAPFLAGLDLEQDLVVFTADHGHTARGGHGGRAPEVARVLTCFAGRGVARRRSGGGMLARDLAPALSVLLGLPFPRNMRAGADDLDVIWELVDARAFPAAYLDERRAALDRFRAANPDWPEIYAEGRARQALRLGLVAAVIGAGLVWAARARPPGGSARLRGAGGGARRSPLKSPALGLLAHLGVVVAATLLLHLWARGSLDLSAINKRAPYIRVATLVCLGPALVALAASAALAGSLARAAADQAVVVAVGLAIVVGHPFVFGWRVGFPLPPPFLYFLPFLSALFLIVHGLALAAAAALARGRPTVPS